MSECKIAQREDLLSLAICHAKAFPRALSSRQGTYFNMKMFEWYLVAERGVLFLVKQDGKVIGYCAGIRTYQPGIPGAFTSISQYAFWAFVFAYVRRPWLVFHPENLKKRSGIARNILIRLGLGKASSKLEVGTHKAFRSYWGLVAIGVDPDAQGQGYGSVLLKEFERLARADGVDLIQLSVRATNQKAIACYERNGWSVVCRSGEALAVQKQLRAFD